MYILQSGIIKINKLHKYNLTKTRGNISCTKQPKFFSLSIWSSMSRKK